MKPKYIVKPTAQFKKDYKTAIKRNLDINELQTVIKTLANGEKLDDKYADHALQGRWKGHRECHIAPDWLLIYILRKDVLVLSFARTGTIGAFSSGISLCLSASDFIYNHTECDFL